MSNTIQDVIQHINNERKSNRDKWCIGQVEYNNTIISYKFYNTWMQALMINGHKHSNTMQVSVREFKKFIEEALNYEQ